jgi:hypothetical protein
MALAQSAPAKQAVRPKTRTNHPAFPDGFLYCRWVTRMPLSAIEPLRSAKFNR